MSLETTPIKVKKKAYTVKKITNNSLTVSLSEQFISLSRLIAICEHLDSEHHRSRVTTR